MRAWFRVFFLNWPCSSLRLSPLAEQRPRDVSGIATFRHTTDAQSPRPLRARWPHPADLATATIWDENFDGISLRVNTLSRSDNNGCPSAAGSVLSHESP